MRIHSLPLIALVLFVLAGCSKSDTLEKTEKTNYVSTLKGMVFLYDEGWVMVDPSGMTVSIENTNPLVSAVTNSKGEFSLPNDTALKSFALVYSKSKCGTYKQYFIRSGDSLYVYQGQWQDTGSQKKVLVNGGNILGVTLGHKSTITVNSLQASFVNGQLKLACNVSAPGFIQLFYQKNMPNISFATVPKTAETLFIPLQVAQGNNNLDNFYTPGLYVTSGFHSGDTIYMTAYGNSAFENMYLDRTTNTVVMPNVNPNSNVTPISFVLP